LIHASIQKETTDNDIETMYLTRTRENHNYHPRESYGKKINSVVRLYKSYVSSIRGIQHWEYDKRESLHRRVMSTQPSHKNQMHPSCRKK